MTECHFCFPGGGAPVITRRVVKQQAKNASTSVKLPSLPVPAIELIQESLAAGLTRRQEIQSEAARSARVDGNKTKRSSSKPAAITSQSLAAMQSRALCVFQRSVARLQALTDDDFDKVATLNLVSGSTLLLDASATAAVPSRGSGKETSPSSTINTGVGSEGANPTPSLSAPRSRLLCLRSPGSSDDRNATSRGNECTEEETDQEERSIVPLLVGENASTEEAAPLADTPQAENASSFSSFSAGAVLRVLRATVVVLGGCGLGPLPSDKELWEAVKPMLVDGSFRHRVRHFDRRVRTLSAWCVFCPLIARRKR